MKIQLQTVLPAEIERRSMELISEELRQQNLTLDPVQAPVIKRAIHTTADFEYAKSLVFSDHAVEHAQKSLCSGACIVTDTQMAKAGINKASLARFGGEVLCFMSDEDVAAAAKRNGTTRACASMDKAASLTKPMIFVIGNAPTALIRLYELIEEGKIHPQLVVAVPVGFVNVVESKELILQTSVPSIVARGRKGGSNVAAAIMNALLYSI